MSDFKPISVDLSPPGAPADDDPSVLLGFEPEAPFVEPVVRIAAPAEKVPVPAEEAAVPTRAAAPVSVPVPNVRLFQPDPPIGPPAQPVPDVQDNPPPASSVSLAQVEASGLSLRWYEAVAIVEGVCTSLIERRQEKTTVDVHTVFISADGQIYVWRAELRDAAAAVRALGGLLGGLGGIDLPAPLKFVVSKATSSPPNYRSIQELSQALAYFARPNRVELLEGLYERWHTLPSAAPSSAPTKALTNDDPTVSNLTDIANALNIQTPSTHPPRDLRLLPAAAILALMVCGLTIWAVNLRSRNNAVGPGTPTVASAPRRAEAAVSNGGSNHGTARQDVARRDAVGQSAGAVVGTNSPGTVGPNDDAWIGSPLQQAPGGGGTRLGDGSVSPAPVAADSVEFSGATFWDHATYSAADQDVVPPVAVYPKLPTLGPADPGVAGFEIIVTETGNVESVKASDLPNSIGHALQMTSILSAAKAWRFRPASKDGHSVRYHLLVWLQVH